jgi:hypothetical protein
MNVNQNNQPAAALPPVDSNSGQDRPVVTSSSTEPSIIDPVAQVALASSSNQASSSDSVLNPIELSKKVRSHLTRLGLRVKDLAPYLKVSKNIVCHLLNDKLEWEKHKEVKRDQYRLMNAWLIEHENKEPGEAVVDMPLSVIADGSHVAEVPNSKQKASVLKATEVLAAASNEVSSLIICYLIHNFVFNSNDHIKTVKIII